jgi:flotillin
MDYIFMSGVGAVSFLFLVIGIWIITMRRVVNANEVHIVSRQKKSFSYGMGEDTNGNVYYEIPSWVPYFGIQKVVYPISVFSESIDGYDAYDKGRLPFVLDLVAFFRISDSATASQRVANFEALRKDLRNILQGAARSILASKDIEEILEGRTEFGVLFTKEVDDQLKGWGVTTVKSIELMDIRDSKESNVIRQIMEKKKSFIEMESRVEVANNTRISQMAEIDSQREVELNKQLAQQQVGIRTAEKEKTVGIAKEQAVQEIKVQQKVTAERDMEVAKVNEVKRAEIDKQVKIIKSEEHKQQTIIESEASKEKDIITAEGIKQKLVIEADGKLQAKLKESEGITAEGIARATSEEKLQLATVNPQIVLANEIGSNKDYQHYLITIEQVNANKEIGIAQAKSLEASDLKIIVNSGDVSSGVKSIGDVFSSNGGAGLGAALEGLSNTPAGKLLINKFLGGDTATSK